MIDTFLRNSLKQHVWSVNKLMLIQLCRDIPLLRHKVYGGGFLYKDKSMLSNCCRYTNILQYGNVSTALSSCSARHTIFCRDSNVHAYPYRWIFVLSWIVIDPPMSELKLSTGHTYTSLLEGMALNKRKLSSLSLKYLNGFGTNGNFLQWIWYPFRSWKWFLLVNRTSWVGAA